MQATVDISMYPLTEDYRNRIRNFAIGLRADGRLKVETDGMRTQITGDYDAVMESLNGEMKKALEETKAVFIIKLAKGDRSGERFTDI